MLKPQLLTCADPGVRENLGSQGAWRHAGLYAGLVALPATAIAAVCWFVLANASSGARAVNLTQERPDSSALLHILVALAVILGFGRLCGWCCSMMRQPPVIGELIAGVLLGPSLLGAVAPSASAVIFPAAIMPTLNTIGQLGIILFMFIVGLEFSHRLLRHQAHVAVLVSHTSILFPFLCGTLLGLLLYPSYAPEHTPRIAFVLFVGLSMSVTAFPVLARILWERKMHDVPLGATALACAAADDITAWCLLAAVLGLIHAQVGAALQVVVLAAAYTFVLWHFVQPRLARLLDNDLFRGRTSRQFTVLMFGVLLSAFITEWIGIHAIFGAFIFGLCIPRIDSLIISVRERLECSVGAILMPAFFAYTGLRTELGLVQGVDGWLLCLAILAIATAGKFVGAFLPARLLGLSSQDSASLGILMNTRGLMEIVILNIGLDFQIISPALYSMLVVMAIVTTLATGPLLDLVCRGRTARDFHLT